MHVYFIQEHLDRKVFHGGICNVDAEKIFIRKGFIPVVFPYHYSFSLKAKLARLGHLVKIFFSIPADAAIIFQFPLYAGMNRILVRALGFRKRIRLVCFITDIDGMRDGDTQLLQREITAFRRYRYFIVHNDKMKQWLTENAGPVSTGQIDFFDYLTTPVSAERKKSFEIAFAGNLSKSVFLDLLAGLQQHSPHLFFYIYGQSPSEAMLALKNVSYKGITEPYQTPAAIKGSFGLVWDGDAIDRLGGHFGLYLQYNSPHKLSLYILSGMPLIANAASAAAVLVRQHAIGIIVDSLFDLERAIAELTEHDYQKMVNNTKKLAGLISRGEMLWKAADDILNS